MNTIELAPGLKTIVRDWLDANHVLITGRDECVLMDSGCSAHAQRTLALLRAPEALGGRPLDRLVNTHCHSDHMGGNAAIARAYGSRISLPADAAKVVERWDTRELLLDYADQHAERFSYSDVIAADDTLQLGDTRWRALTAPGHDMSALVFYNAEHRVLVSGDALWERGFGLIEPVDRLDERLAAQRATLERIAALEVAWVVPGHGAPFSEIGAALEHAFNRLDAYAGDPLKLARHCLKAFFMFTLLGRGRFACEELPSYFERIPCYREYNARFFQLAPAALAEKITGELVHAGVIAQRDGELVPVAH